MRGGNLRVAKAECPLALPPLAPLVCREDCGFVDRRFVFCGERDFIGGLTTLFFNFFFFSLFYDNSPKHLFFQFLCKSTIPHPVHVENVDKFVYNSIFKGFPTLKKVENFCTYFCTINIFRQPLCKVLNLP